MKTYTCPECGSEQLLVYSSTAYRLNEDEAFFCHASKTHDDDAKCRCQVCDWTGERRDLKETR